MAKKISEHTLSILSKVTIEGNNIFLTCGQLDRKDYVAVNECLENLNGKWNKKLKCHVYDCDPSEKLENLLLTGEITNIKQEYGFFPTPPELAKRVVELACIESNHTVLEPSAGFGNLADEASDYTYKANLFCVEIQPDNANLLREKGYYTVMGDFLTLSFDCKFDRITMNPPFALQNDIKHVMKAWSYLKEGGILVSIMSMGFTFRENKLSFEFRKLVEENGYYEKNPSGSFKQAGTAIETVTVVLRK